MSEIKESGIEKKFDVNDVNEREKIKAEATETLKDIISRKDEIKEGDNADAFRELLIKVFEVLAIIVAAELGLPPEATKAMIEFAKGVGETTANEIGI